MHENLVNFGCVVFELCEQTDKRTDILITIRHIYRFRGRSNNKIAQSNWEQAALRRKLSTFAPKLPIPVDRSPNPTTCLIPRPIRRTIPNRIYIRSAVLPQCNGQTDRQTDTHRPTDVWRECSMTIGRFRSLEKRIENRYLFGRG